MASTAGPADDGPAAMRERSRTAWGLPCGAVRVSGPAPVRRGSRPGGPLAEEPHHGGGVGGQRRLGLGVQRRERCEHDLAARDVPGRHGPAAGQCERPEQPVDRDDPPVRADDGVPGSPAEQQRLERAQQQWRRQRGSRSPRVGWQLGQAVCSLDRAAPGQAEPGIRSLMPAHWARSRSAAGACPARYRRASSPSAASRLIPGGGVPSQSRASTKAWSRPATGPRTIRPRMLASARMCTIA